MANHDHPLYPEPEFRNKGLWENMRHQICACLNHYGEALTAAEIAALINSPVDPVSFRLSKMCKSGWLKRSERKSVCRYSPRVNYRYSIRNRRKMPWSLVDHE